MSTEHLLGTVGTILDALMGPDDQARRLAEAEINNLTTRQPGEILLLLAQIGAQGVGGYQVDHRFLSLLLLKRLAFAELPGLHLNPSEPHPTAPFDYIAESMRGRIETVLCAGLQDEMNIRMRKGLGTCLGSWAIKSNIRQRPVLRLPPVLLELTRSPHPFHRFTPFQLLDIIPTLLVDSVTDPLPPQAIAQLLIGGLHDPSLDVRVEAVKAVKGVVMQAFRANERNQIGPSLVVEMFTTIAPLPPSLMTIALSALVELAVYYPDLFVPSLPSILPFLLSLLSPPAQHPPPVPLSPYPLTHWRVEEWTNLSNPVTELLLNLLEVRRAQLVAWEEGRAGRELLGLLIARQIVEFELLGDDCADWLQTDDPEEADMDYPDSAELSLDRLSMILGGDQVLPTLSQHAQVLLQRPEWRCRYVALMAIQATCEGSAEEMVPKLQDVLSLISATSEDPYPRVRYGFLYCLGQLAVDCDGALQENFSPQVIDVCGRLLKDEHARIRAQAAACLGMFLSQATLEQVEPFIAAIVPALLECFHSGPNYLKVNVIGALANLGSVGISALVPHYRTIMDLLLQILLASHSKEDRPLVAETLHAASLIGQAVGKAMFSGDAVRLATIMISMQNTVTDAGDPRVVELMSAWFKVCAVLGDDFVPFIQHVMPPLLHAAAFEPPPSATAEADDDATLVSEASGNEKSIEVVHTAELGEKAVAFDNLSSYAALLPKHFGPFLDVSMKLAIDALAFEYDENVRESAAFLIPSLLRVAKETNAWTTPEPLQHTFRSLIRAIKDEGDYTYLPVLFKAFSDSVTVVSLPLPMDIASEFFDSTCTILDQWIEVRKERRAMEDDMDPGDREFLREEEAEEDLCLDNALEAAQEILRVAGGEGTTEQGLSWGVARVEGKVAAARSAGEVKPSQ